MATSAHRKVVTVLFCDVVGSTALGESVDPEALQGLLAHSLRAVREAKERSRCTTPNTEFKPAITLARATRERLASLQPV